MKRVFVLVLAVFLSLGFTTTVLAQGPADEYDMFQQKLATAKMMSFQGTVLSHDTFCHCIVVKTAKGELVLQDDYAKFDQDYNRLKGLKIGSAVKGQYKTVNRINYALSVSYK